MNSTSHFLASRLRSLRTGKGLNQAEVAELIGCEPNTIGRYERSETMPNIEHLLRLAEVYGVSPLEMLPPPSSESQRLIALRQDLTEKVLQVNSPETLEDLINQVDAHISANRASRK